MTITYKAGNRLVLQSDYEDNFSYADQSTANAAWEVASNVAGRRVNITNGNLELENDSGTTNYAVVHDLGASVVSTTEWTLRFSADVTLNSGSNNWCYIGLFNSDESVGGGTNQNFITVAFQNDGANTKFWSVAGVGKNVNAGNTDYFGVTGNGTLTSSKYYIQIRRLTATSMDVKIFTDPNYSSEHVSMSMSGSSLSLGDLRYIKFANNTTSGSGSIDIVMDDVKFYNGTMEKPTNPPNNSTFTETDSGREFMLNYGAWTETNQPSSNIAELLNDYSSVRKQHMWDWCGGSAPSSRWTLQGSGTVVMNDGTPLSIGGLLLKTAASADANCSIDFNNKRQYDQTNCVFICVGRRYDSSTRASFGMTNTTARTANFADCVDDSANTYKSLRSVGATGTPSDTVSSIAVNASDLNCMKLEFSASDIKMSIDGVLRVTKDSDRPAAKLQPSLDALTRDSTANGSLTRYIEAYNN